MEENRKVKCFQASFRNENSDWGQIISGGYVTIGRSSGACYITYTDTGNVLKKSAHLVAETSDMIPDAAMIVGRLGLETAKAFLGMKNGAARRQSAQAAAKNMESLKKKYSEHQSNHFRLEELEKTVIKCRLTSQSVVECVTTRLGTSALILHSYRIEQAQDAKSRYEVCHFLFNNSTEAKRVAEIIQDCVPSITIRYKTSFSMSP